MTTRARRLRVLLSVLAVVALASGCFRMHTRVPGALRGDLEDEQVIVRDRVDVEHTRVYLFWGLLPLGDDDALGRAVLDEAREAGGTGLANVVFEAYFTPGDLALQMLTLGVLSPRTYRLRGDVVRISADALPGGTPRNDPPEGR